jgi:CDP-glucose 4,6-dehydratase
MRCENDIASTVADIRDLGALHDTVSAFRPELVFHLAAQSLVKQSYVDPAGTYSTNVIGTVHVLETARRVESIRAVVNITSDKCYENRNLDRGYKETDPLGGHDPYSSSKACAEIVTSAYSRSYFDAGSGGRAAIASARAGNVIGGGDWAPDRLIPDLVRGARERTPVLIRSPAATRPWQHVLEPLSGYLQLAEALIARGTEVAGAWNFGPGADGDQQVSWIADRFCAAWGSEASWSVDRRPHPHEAKLLKLDSSKAREHLHWRSRWSVAEALDASIAWYKAYYAGENMDSFTVRQIDSYLGRLAR